MTVTMIATATTPTTKAGKNNGYRQTNARTVYIIKYIKKI